MEASSLEEANIIISLLAQQRDTLNNEYVKAIAANMLQQGLIIELQGRLNSNK